MGETEEPVSKGITPLLAPIQAVQNLLQRFNNQGVIIGGVAVSLLGTPRFTVDVDVVFMLGLSEIPTLLTEAEKQGIVPRITDPVDFARRNRVLLLRHDASGTDIDISLGILPFEAEMVARSNTCEIGQIQIRIPTPEDLIIMKAVARRPKDLEDIKAIRASHPVLDRARIQYWIEQFGEALDLPDLWGDISQLL